MLEYLPIYNKELDWEGEIEDTVQFLDAFDHSVDDPEHYIAIIQDERGPLKLGRVPTKRSLCDKYRIR